jgi:hypothetical protein
MMHHAKVRVCAAAVMIIGRASVLGQIIPRGVSPPVGSPDCNTLDVLWDKTQSIDAECPGAPTTCSVSCGAALLPFLDECGSFMDALSVFDDADGVHDGRANRFPQINSSMSSDHFSRRDSALTST